MHVVFTRFMQQQAHLKHLARARLDLFKVFCLPSMLRQTHQEFFWVVLVDPELDADIRQEMVDLLKDHPNYYVLTSQAPLTISGGAIAKRIMVEADKGQFFTGDDTVLKANLLRLHRLVVLETNHDADDGRSRRAATAAHPFANCRSTVCKMPPLR